MGMNFQDVIRDVHDSSNHALQISGTIQVAGQATVNINGSATIFAVVNTSAAGVGNSIVTVANPNFGINTGVNGIGFATVNLVNQPALVASSANIGSVSVLGGTINAVPQTSTLNIGSVSVLGGGIGLNAGVNGIGFVTVNGGFIKNGGTNKTLVNLPIAFSTASITTVVTPSTSNSIYITNLLLNSNATVRITLKSGVTYLTGNASIGVTLNPGGGLVMTGSPDSPSWIGLPSGAFVVEKLDLTGTSAQIAGSVVYFQE